MLFPKNTRYFNISRNAARVTIVMVVGLIIFGLGSLTSDNPDKSGAGEDLRCYRSIVDRIRSGEGYYQAAYSELVSRGYPTGSIFNWRPPLLGWTFGHLPDLRIALAAAIFLSLFTLWLWVSVSSKELSFGKVAAGSLLLLGAPIYSFSPDIYLSHEFWAGALITLSIFSYAKGWRCIALMAGTLSLLTRELALPFVAVMSASSIHDRKYGEAFMWAAGITIFFIMMLLHSYSLKEFAQPDNIYAFEHWVTLGGWTFVLETTRMHPYLFLLPVWLTAVLVPLTLLGLSGWRGPLGSRIGLTVGIYIFIFLFVGQEFNRYWGVVYVNLLPLGLLFTLTVAINLYDSIINQVKLTN